jgi:hypothetical protein
LICAALARQTTNAQAVTIAAPQIAIAGANQVKGRAEIGCAARRDVVCR